LCTFLCNKGGREDITPWNTSDNTFKGRNVYTTAKQGTKATLVYLLSGRHQPCLLTWIFYGILKTYFCETDIWFWHMKLKTFSEYEYFTLTWFLPYLTLYFLVISKDFQKQYLDAVYELPYSVKNLSLKFRNIFMKAQTSSSIYLIFFKFRDSESWTFTQKVLSVRSCHEYF
jgi:hypothetical protein